MLQGVQTPPYPQRDWIRLEALMLHLRVGQAALHGLTTFGLQSRTTIYRTHRKIMTADLQVWCCDVWSGEEEM
jgi:hypothetical protein